MPRSDSEDPRSSFATQSRNSKIGSLRTRRGFKKAERFRAKKEIKNNLVF